jgi:hypothetical protein
MEQPRPDRPLGRGLEQVSRVFLTPESAEAVSDARGERPARPLAREEPAGPLLLRPAAALAREQVAAAVKEFAGALEEGLRIIDGGIPCAPCGEIDFLAVDRKNQLAVVDFGTAATDELLVRGLGHVDWMVGNVPNLRRMFRGSAINFSLQPRLFLLAPQFSAAMRCAARQVASPEIAWIRYHAVETPGRTGIFFERLPEE